ncbi:hypothetical protein WA026_017332 [Henosepilachna vigintioctopunctata]|uniref:Odorant receptor n=1 Tax=Henosepilachna vigintioctopunctata TaxID=420089 RepID=A0AAW1UL49_9CUCU
MDGRSDELQLRKQESMVLYEKLSNIKEFRRNMKDELALLLHLTINLLQMRFVHSIFIYVACQYAFGLCLTIHHLLSTFDKRNLLKYGSFVGIDIFVLINLWTVIVKYNEITWFIHTLRGMVIPIDKDIVGEIKYKRIMFTRMLVKFIVLVDYGLALAAALGIFLSPEYFNSKNYLPVWIRKNFINYSEYILFFIHLTIFPVALALVSLSIALMYCVLTSVSQLTLINIVIKGICHSSIHPDERYDSELFQSIVLQKLKICVMIHQICIRMSLYGAEILYSSIISFSTGAVILGGSLLVEFYTNDPYQGNHEYFAIVCFALSGLLTASLYVTSGQLLKDQSEKIYDLLVSLPWYYMNEENKRIYSIFLRRAFIPISLTNNLIEINLVLLVRIVKSIYSIAALLFQFVRGTSSGIVQ